MAVKTYRKTALVIAEQFQPAIGQIPKGVYSTALGDPRKRPDAEWVLDTKEARHTLRGGDYICTGPAGEKWNVAQEIFEATYEEVAALTTPPQPVEAGGEKGGDVLDQPARVGIVTFRKGVSISTVIEAAKRNYKDHAHLGGSKT